MKIKGRKAFSLIELSIVLLIISIMVAGAVTVSTALVTKSKIELTKKRMDEVYKAMGQYLLKNYAMPCPASLRIARSAANYGVAGTAGVCGDDGIYTSNLDANIVYGMVPVNDLGLSSEMAEDGFGTKFGYAINKNFTKAEYPTATNNNGFSFNNSSANMIRIYQHPSMLSIDGVVFAIISHGPNKSGGFNALSSNSQNNGSSDGYEYDNQISGEINNVNPISDTAYFGNNISFPSQVTFANSDLSSSVFDDILLFKRRSDILFDFNANFLVGCDNSTTNWVSGFSNAFHGEVVYKSSACSSPNSNITAAKQCSALGDRWVDYIKCP